MNVYFFQTSKLKTTETCSKKPSEIRKIRTSLADKFEEVFSDPTLFKAYVDSVEEFYAQFDKNDFFAAQPVAKKILRTKKRYIRKGKVEIAKRMARKYRSVLLGQQKVAEDQVLSGDIETVEEQVDKNEKNVEVADHHNVSSSST